MKCISGGLIFTFIFLFSCPEIRAQSDLNLVKTDELAYTSSFEESVFNAYLTNNSSDYFALFLCIDSSITTSIAEKYRSDLIGQVGKFQGEYYREMNPKKKVQKIYTEIHENMLDKYVLYVPFSSIFKNKEYHCVSSSMLFALVFSSLDIPFDIRVIPNHVYLVAYPESLYITVETTDPLNGTLVYDETFKAKFVEYLRDAKLIGKDEYNSTGTNELFEKYFNQTDTVPMQALASYQYRNMILELINERKYDLASQYQEKAWLLLPDPTNTYLLMNCWLLSYTSKNKDDFQAVEILGKLSRFCGHGISTDVIMGEFAQITQRQLIYNGEVLLYDSSYYELMNYIADSSLRDEISFLYNFERGRLLFNQMEYPEALPYNQKAYSLKPKNEDAKHNFLFSLMNTYENEPPDKRLVLVNDISTQLPSLLDDNLFCQLRLTTYLELIDKSFYEKNISSGEKYMKEFETIYPQRNSKYSLIDEYIETAYGTAASYYFKTGQSPKSRAVLEKGLLYVPGSYPLKNRLNAVK